MPKILIIEDEGMLMDMYKDKFEKEGFRVLTASGSVEGLKLLKSEKPDLVLLDILLPDKSGLYFLEEKRKHPELKNVIVIAFSNYDAKETKKKAQELGAAGYLIKTDYTPAQIIDKIKSYLKLEHGKNPDRKTS